METVTCPNCGKPIIPLRKYILKNGKYSFQKKRKGKYCDKKCWLEYRKGSFFSTLVTKEKAILQTIHIINNSNILRDNKFFKK